MTTNRKLTQGQHLAGLQHAVESDDWASAETLISTVNEYKYQPDTLHQIASDVMCSASHDWVVKLIPLLQRAGAERAYLKVLCDRRTAGLRIAVLMSQLVETKVAVDRERLKKQVMACVAANPDYISLLENPSQNTNLHLAVLLEDQELITLFVAKFPRHLTLENQDSVFKRPLTPLLLAALRSKWASVEVLLSDKLSCQYESETLNEVVFRLIQQPDQSQVQKLLPLLRQAGVSQNDITYCYAKLARKQEAEKKQAEENQATREVMAFQRVYKALFYGETGIFKTWNFLHYFCPLQEKRTYVELREIIKNHGKKQSRINAAWELVPKAKAGYHQSGALILDKKLYFAIFKNAFAASPWYAKTNIVTKKKCFCLPFFRSRSLNKQPELTDKQFQQIQDETAINGGTRRSTHIYNILTRRRF